MACSSRRPHNADGLEQSADGLEQSWRAGAVLTTGFVTAQVMTRLLVLGLFDQGQDLVSEAFELGRAYALDRTQLSE